ncbi:hypothetical protein BMS3Abin15_01084 [bacterium BMS3Abin15]|nr:hypothetical protein BMS3Abin15_01084 [bacterium BMS3Abin15]HDZ85807.1 hypothetical protein [Candidatus Moranbacteria bacterium]
MICNSKKKGFTFIEIVIIVVIIGIMTSVVLVSVGGNKSSKVVEIAAREIAGSIREAQNNALNGKQINDGTGDTACGHGFYFDNDGDGSGLDSEYDYKLFYNYDNSGTPNDDCSEALPGVGVAQYYADHSLGNKVEFSDSISKSIYFTMPHGTVYQNSALLGGSAKILLVSPGGSDYYTICVYASGRVEEKKDDVPC